MNRSLLTSALLFCFAASLVHGTVAGHVDGNGQQQEKKPQDDQPLRLKTELIEVRAVVTDRENRPVEGLKKEDFEVLEGNRPQEISFFTEQRLTRPGQTATPQTDRAPSSIARVNPADISRWVILFVDTLHLSGSNLLRVKQTLKNFVDTQLGDQDAVLLVTSTGTDALAAHFTKDRQLLRYAIDRIAMWGARTSYFTPSLAASVRRGDPTAIELGIKIIESEDRMPLPPTIARQVVEARAGAVLAEATYKRKNLIGTLRAATDLMGTLAGQRLMVLLSDGFSMFDSQGSFDSSELRAVISRAVRHGVVINSIDAGGLEPPPQFDASRPGINARPGALESAMSDSEKANRDGMNALAKDTGGEFFFNTNDLKGSMQRTFDNNRVYYALAYYPTDESGGDKFRQITVRVKGHPDYKVRAQRGYAADDLLAEKVEPAGSTQKQFFQKIAAPMPATDIRITASADYLEAAADKSQVSLRVRIDGGNLTYREDGRKAAMDVEVAAIVFDRGGKLVQTYTEKLEAKIESKTLEQAKRTGFSYGKRLELKPGLYIVRVGVREPATERLGTAVSWVEVPDLSKGKFAASNILLADGAGQKQAGEGISADATEWRPVKSYKTGGLLVYYLVLYNIAEKDEGEMLMRSETLQGEQVVYQSDWMPISSRAVGREKRGVEIGGQVNLSLKPGVYELRISIKNAKSDKPTQRTVIFAVEE